MRGTTWALALLAAVSACSAGGGGAIEGGVPDGIIEVGLDLPPGCPPDAGNANSVGKPCTMGGGECKGNSELRCACDPILKALLVGVPCFCTLARFAQNGSTDPCKDSVPATFCGTGATCCNYLTSAAYCVPNICLPGGNMCIDFSTTP